jgi:hypothetical protein
MMQNRPSFQTYYALIDRNVSAYLDKQDSSYLVSVDKEQYLDQLVQVCRWEPLTWDESGMTVEPFIQKVERRSDFGDRTYLTDQSMLRLRIPCSSHPQLSDYLKNQPSTFKYSEEPAYKFSGNVMVLEVEASDEAVKRLLDDLKFWLGGRNKDIEQGNATLKERIRPIWEARRQRLEQATSSTEALLQRLNIPRHEGS